MYLINICFFEYCGNIGDKVDMIFVFIILWFYGLMGKID